jgi:uncharacterized LabA/DUF88 family protein
MTDRLFVLIDYDNLGDFRTGKTFEAVLRHVESQIPDEFLEGIARLEMRLYGGWVTGRSLTRQAQTLSAEIQGGFPATTQRLDNLGNAVTRILSVGFARSGLFLPSEDLLDTFMPGRSLGSIKVDQSAWRLCAAPSTCPLTVVESFITGGRCQVAGCGVSARELLKKNEQKQVDTLLVADMAELVLRQGANRLVIVSSDADMWPGVLLCLAAGASVCQVHTAPGGTTKHTLKVNLRRLGAAYKETSV